MSRTRLSDCFSIFNIYTVFEVFIVKFWANKKFLLKIQIKTSSDLIKQLPCPKFQQNTVMAILVESVMSILLSRLHLTILERRSTIYFIKTFTKTAKFSPKL